MKLDELNVARVLVTGAAKWTGAEMIESILSTLAANQQATGASFRVITGMANGADAIARDWATANEVNLHAEPLESGKIAQAIHACNERMLALQPELILAFKSNFDRDWTADSRTAGTEHMCRIAARADVPILLNGEHILAIESKSEEDEEEQEPLAEHPDNVEDQVPATAQASSAAIELECGEVTLRIVQGDITEQTCDVIVNAANSNLQGGGGVDGAIHQAAGPSLLEACRTIRIEEGELGVGKSVITTAGDLPSKHVVHTVGPRWKSNPANHDICDEALASCYQSALTLAAEADAKSIAFPGISTGAYRFPKDRAAHIAFDAIESFVMDNPESPLREITMVCFSAEDLAIFEEMLAE